MVQAFSENIKSLVGHECCLVFVFDGDKWSTSSWCSRPTSKISLHILVGLYGFPFCIWSTYMAEWYHFISCSLQKVLRTSLFSANILGETHLVSTGHFCGQQFFDDFTFNFKCFWACAICAQWSYLVQVPEIWYHFWQCYFVRDDHAKWSGIQIISPKSYRVRQMPSQFWLHLSSGLVVCCLWALLLNCVTYHYLDFVFLCKGLRLPFFDLSNICLFYFLRDSWYTQGLIAWGYNHVLLFSCWFIRFFERFCGKFVKGNMWSFSVTS